MATSICADYVGTEELEPPHQYFGHGAHSANNSLAKPPIIASFTYFFARECVSLRHKTKKPWATENFPPDSTALGSFDAPEAP